MEKEKLKKEIKPIIIYETKKCDTRAIEKIFTDEDVKSDTLKHREAVIAGCDFIADKLREQSFNHDYTKLGKYLPLFTRALKTGFKNDEFKKIDWWNIHKTKERHHLNDNCPDDVNIIDVIEMIVDCTMAGLARTGKVYDISIKPEILKKAINNTVKLLIDNTKVLK